MKLRLEQSEGLAVPEVVVRYGECTPEVRRIIDFLSDRESAVPVRAQDRTLLLPLPECYYFESVDKRTFAYTESDCYETGLRLYELVDRFEGVGLFRASKSTVVNTVHIRRITPLLGGRLELLLENGERLLVSRQYVPALRKILGL